MSISETTPLSDWRRAVARFFGPQGAGTNTRRETRRQKLTFDCIEPRLLLNADLAALAAAPPPPPPPPPPQAQAIVVQVAVDTAAKASAPLSATQGSASAALAAITSPSFAGDLSATAGIPAPPPQPPQAQEIVVQAAVDTAAKASAPLSATQGSASAATDAFNRFSSFDGSVENPNGGSPVTGGTPDTGGTPETGPAPGPGDAESSLITAPFRNPWGSGKGIPSAPKDGHHNGGPSSEDLAEVSPGGTPAPIVVEKTIAETLALNAGEVSGAGAFQTRDTAAHVQALTPTEIGALAAKGVTRLTASDSGVTLSAAQAIALETAQIADVAQAEAARAQAQADVAAARQGLAASLVDYREATGESPQRLEPAPSCEARLPEKVDGAFERAEAENPQLVAALHQTEAAKFGVDAALGALAPTLSIGAQVFQQYDSYLGYPGTRQFSAQVTGMLNIPLYEGGAEYASVRQARQQLSQARSHLSALSSVIRSKLAAAYSRLETAKAAMRFGAVNIRAAEQALSAVRDEAEVGQRTFLDVLNAQQALLDARVKMVAAQHDRVVASYAALAEIGGLTAGRLGLAVDVYDPAKNFEAVRGLWFGLDTPQEH